MQVTSVLSVRKGSDLMLFCNRSHLNNSTSLHDVKLDFNNIAVTEDLVKFTGNLNSLKYYYKVSEIIKIFSNSSPGSVETSQIILHLAKIIPDNHRGDLLSLRKCYIQNIRGKFAVYFSLNPK